MRLTREFTVPADIDRAWGMLTDLGRVAPCLPGTTVEAVDGDELTGRVGLRIGPMNTTYTGVVRIVVKDATNKLATIEARGRDDRGAGTARARVRAGLSEIEGATRVTLATDLHLTGRVAQLGPEPVHEVGSQLLASFAERLAARIGEPTPPAAAAASAADASATTDGPEPARGVRPPKKLLVGVGMALLVAGALARRLRRRYERDR